MGFRSHEIPQRASHDSKRIINKAIAEGHLVYITYRDREGNETKREIKPLEWVEDYKLRAFCYLKQAERYFVLTGIREISLIVGSTDEAYSVTDRPHGEVNPRISNLEQWQSSGAVLSGETITSPHRRSPQFGADQRFSRVVNAAQWKKLIEYYTECLTREYLQDYLIDQQKGRYHFFPADEDIILRSLAGNALFFHTMIKNQPTTLSNFIIDPTKRDQQLCLGYPSLLTPDRKIAPLFFIQCAVEKRDDSVILHPDEYEISYALFQSLNLDKEELAGIVTDLGQNDFEAVSDKIKALQEALVLKLEELTKQVIPRREVNRPQFTEAVKQITLFKTPCLFWASKNNITGALIKELGEISTLSLDKVPHTLLHLINISEQNEYPDPMPLSRDDKVYITPINEEQRRAAHAALVRPITVVTGPPGTGKSQLVMNIIANAVIEGRSVLFASRNNQAVNVVASRMQKDMSFRGMIRTGNNIARRAAADSMLDALSVAATPHVGQEVELLLENYKQTKTILARRIDTLNEVRQLTANLTAKRHDLESLLMSVPQNVAELIRQGTIASEDAIEESRKALAALTRVYEGLQQRKKTVEAVLQEHITDNRHRHLLIEDIKNFETEWGSFGDNIRDANFFPSLESLQRYIEQWIQFLDAVESRITMEKTSAEVERISETLADLISNLPHELQYKAQNVAEIISEVSLNALNTEISTIGNQLSRARKRTFSNCFGLRRGRQVDLIIARLNRLLHKLGQPLITKAPDFHELYQQFKMVENYGLVVFNRRSLTSKQVVLEDTERKVLETTSVFNEKTLSDFKRLRIQREMPITLREMLTKNMQVVSGMLIERYKATSAFYVHAHKNTPVSTLWSQFQNEIGQDEYPGWTLDSEVNMEVLRHFATQWVDVLNAMVRKADILQLEAVIEGKGGEEGAVIGVNVTQEKADAQAIEILNTLWLRNIGALQHERVQRVFDYARLTQEVSENYDRQVYGQMMSIQDQHLDDIIAAFPVWATTNLSIGRNFPLKAELFDLVIIDEASQCDIPSALPLIYRAKQLVIIGDAKQLRHIATLTEDGHQILADEYNVATEAYSYTKHSLFDLATRSVGLHHGVLMLREHYRSHEDIIRFSNQAFYNGNLLIKTDMTTRKIPPSVLQKACGMFWLDVPGETIHPTGGSAKNLHEFRAIQELLPEIYRQLKSIAWEGSLGVVTPYREQKNMLQIWVDSKFGQQITVGTAHTFQGDEREILLFSTVLARGISEGSLTWLRKSENLLNVAITRARAILIIVGDFNFCISLPDDNPYKQLAKYVQSGPNSVIQSCNDLPLFSLCD